MTTEPEPFFPIDPHSITEELKHEEQIIRYIYWYSSDGIRQSKPIIDGYETRRFKHDLKTIFYLVKKNLRILTIFFTGHCRLRKHFHIIRISSDETYRFCELKSETQVHTLVLLKAML